MAKNLTRSLNPDDDLSQSLLEIQERQRELLTIVQDVTEEAKAASTWRAYEHAWDVYDRFCESLNLVALPAEPLTVAMFLADQFDKGLALSTLIQRVAAIRAVHVGQGYASPTESQIVKDKLRGLRKIKRSDTLNTKAAATDDVIEQMLATIDLRTNLGQRDRALLLYGYAAALRRSELIGIDVEHIEPTRQGQLLMIPYSKADQAGKGQRVAVLRRAGSLLCPVSAMESWLKASGVQEGPVFRRFFRGDSMSDTRLSDKAVERLVKELAYRARLDSERFAGHSLRRGFITSAVETGARWEKIRDHARHASLSSTAGYMEIRDKFADHAGEGLDD